MRGLWLSHCASDQQVQAAVSGKWVDTRTIMQALDRVSGSQRSSEKEIYDKYFSALSSYTHTGEHQISRWISGAEVRPTYMPAEIEELTKISTSLANLAVVGVKACRAE